MSHRRRLSFAGFDIAPAAAERRPADPNGCSTKRPGSEAGQSNREYHPGLAMAEAYLAPRILSVQKVTQEPKNREQVAIFLS